MAKEPAELVEDIPDLEEDADTDDEDGSIEASKFEHKGKMYLKTEDNVLYDIETHVPVGEWDEDAKDIVEYETDDEEE